MVDDGGDRDDDDRRDEAGDRPEAAGRVVAEDGPNTRGGSNFDPTPYMRQLRGRGGAQDYLDVKWRLLWLRREHPDAEIVTDHVEITDQRAVFKATVTLPTGGKATGYGSETAGDFGDFIEKAETKAIGRALNALGYGAQFAEGEEEASPAPPPRPTRTESPSPPRPAPPAAPPVASTRPAPPDVGRAPEPTARADDAGASPTPMPNRPGAGERVPRPGGPARSAGPIDITAGRERPAGGSAPTPLPSTARPRLHEPAGEGEPPLEDYSWTAFWSWARGLGYRSKVEIERDLDRTIGNLSPAEVRDLLRAKRGDEA